MWSLENSGDDDKCQLLGPVGLSVQGLLGMLAIGSLVWKRYYEYPHRRPWIIWIYDVSKQVIGASFIHVLNLFLSIISKLKVKILFIEMIKKPKEIGDNPCDYYFLNLLFDTTIGIPILYFFILLLSKLIVKCHVDGIKSGEYGNPPKFTNYLKQLFIYLVSLALMKMAIYLILISFPILVRLAVWALSYFDDYPNVQVGFVLLIFPLVMNVFQYYVVDNLIQSKAYYVSNKRLQFLGISRSGSVDEELPEEYSYGGIN